MAPRAPFRRNRAEGFDVVLEAGEAAVLTRLCEELTTLLGGDDDQADPVVERLFPRAYLDPTEEEAEADWQRLAHGDLVAMVLHTSGQLDRIGGRGDRQLEQQVVEAISPNVEFVTQGEGPLPSVPAGPHHSRLQRSCVRPASGTRRSGCRP